MSDADQPGRSELEMWKVPALVEEHRPCGDAEVLEPAISSIDDILRGAAQTEGCDRQARIIIEPDEGHLRPLREGRIGGNEDLKVSMMEGSAISADGIPVAFRGTGSWGAEPGVRPRLVVRPRVLEAPAGSLRRSISRRGARSGGPWEVGCRPADLDDASFWRGRRCRSRAAWARSHDPHRPFDGRGSHCRRRRPPARPRGWSRVGGYVPEPRQTQVAARSRELRGAVPGGLRVGDPQLRSADVLLPTSDGDLVAWVAAEMAAAPPEIAFSAMEHAITFEPAVVRTLRGLRLPVVAINPDDKPTDIDALRRHGVDTVLMSGVCHSPMMEDPSTFNRLLDDTVQQSSTRDARPCQWCRSRVHERRFGLPRRVLARKWLGPSLLGPQRDAFAAHYRFVAYSHRFHGTDP